MQLGFDTESLTEAQAALLLYAIYRSRDEKSSLNGLETWDRCHAYIRGAILKSATVAEFAEHFCKQASVPSIKPHFLKTDGLVKIDANGTLAEVDGMYNYHIEIYKNPGVLDVLTKEAQYIIMLVRERIQRDKELFVNYEA